MAEHKYHQKIQPRYVDLDTEIRYVKSDTGAVRYFSNVRSGKRNDKSKGALVNIRGTLLVPNNYLPSGTNECIGSCTNTSGTFLLFSNWNSNAGHGIYMYNPTFAEPIQLLYSDVNGNEVLGFHRYFKIKGTKSKILEDKHYFWTDAYNSPRYLNIERALNYKKKKIFKIQQIDSDIIDYNVLVFKYNGVLTSLYLSNLSNILTSNPLLSNYFDIEDCSCSIILTEKEANTCDLTTNSSTIRIVGQNFYPQKHHERQIDLLCRPSSTAPSVVLKKDLKQRKNLLNGFTWQFRTKIVYFDNNESAWSAWSKLINTSGGCEEEYNYIQIDYTDQMFDCYNDVSQLSVIKEVVIGYRNTNQGNLHSFVTIKQCDIPKGVQLYDFYNDIYASLEPEYDDKIKQFDTVPLQCGALSAANNRLILGDVTENYEEECFDFNVDVEYHPKDDTQLYNGKIECEIKVLNYIAGGDLSIPISQPTQNSDTYTYGYLENFANYSEAYDERLGTKGFVVYIAGTEHMAITKQIIQPGINPTLTDIEYGILDASTDSLRYQIMLYTNYNQPGLFIQKAEIGGLKDGTYILRVASHWCSYGDKLGKGDAYDLDNGLEWQKTSTNIDSVNGIKNIFEAKVTVLNGVQVGPNPVFRVMSAANQTGKFISLVQGYVIDSRSSQQEDIYQGSRVEGAVLRVIKVSEVVHAERGDPSYGMTDHNGYVFLIAGVRPTDIAGNHKIIVSKGKDINWNNLSGNDGVMEILGENNDPLEGNLTELKNGTCGTFGNKTDNLTQFSVNNFIFPFLTGGHNITDNFRTLVKGRLVNPQGFPIPNVLVVATGTDRIDKTDINGEFGIIVYANSNTRSDLRTVDLIFSGDECNNISAVYNYSITLGRIPPKYNNTNPYLIIPDIVFNVVYNDLRPTYFLKNGDTYDFGVTLMDRGLRKTTVLHSDKKNRIKLPFTTENIQDYFPNLTTDTRGNTITATTKAEGFFTVKFTLISKPPIWCTHIYFLRTEGQVYADYVQMVVSDTKYVVNYRETANPDTGVMEPDPVTTTFENKDANEIYLDLITSFKEYKDRNSSSLKGWTFEKGDRLRFLHNADGDLYSFVEVEIKEQRGNYFVIDNIDSLPELKLGYTVELFRLKTKVTDKQYFEIAEHIKTNNPYTDIRAWSVTTLVPNTGDAYRRIRKMIAKYEDERVSANRLIEDPTPDDSLLEKDNDKGRSDFINYNFKQVRRLSTARYSDKLLPDSLINKIRRFDAEQQFTADINYGAITVIDDFTNVIFIAQENKCSTRYISKTNLYIGNGDVAVSAPGKYVSDDPYYLSDEYGCINPESYVRCKGFGVFYDAINSSYVAYFQQNGLNCISGFDDKYGSSKLQESVFRQFSNQLAKIPKELYRFISQAQSIFNEEENEINLSVSPINMSIGQDISAFSGTRFGSNIGENDAKFKIYDKSEFALQLDGFTLCYDNEQKMWLLNRDYNPTTYGMINNAYIGFVGSDLYRMEAGDDNSFNNFFGTKYKSRIDVLMNIQPSDLKFFTNWSVESNAKWSNPYVEVANSRAFRPIESFTPDGKIVRRQGVFYAPFMFDINTPNVANPVINGNKLVGETLVLRLENDDTTQVILYAINIFAGYVPRSNF